MPGRPSCDSREDSRGCAHEACNTRRPASRSPASSLASSGPSCARPRLRPRTDLKNRKTRDSAVVRYEARAEEPSSYLSTEGQRQPAQLERGSFHDGKMHCGNQPANISLIHRRSIRLVPHHPGAACHLKCLTMATISASRCIRAPLPGQDRLASRSPTDRLHSGGARRSRHARVQPSHCRQVGVHLTPERSAISRHLPPLSATEAATTARVNDKTYCPPWYGKRARLSL